MGMCQSCQNQNNQNQQKASKNQNDSQKNQVKQPNKENKEVKKQTDQKQAQSGNRQIEKNPTKQKKEKLPQKQQKTIIQQTPKQKDEPLSPKKIQKKQQNENLVVLNKSIVKNSEDKPQKKNNQSFHVQNTDQKPQNKYDQYKNQIRKCQDQLENNPSNHNRLKLAETKYNYGKFLRFQAEEKRQNNQAILKQSKDLLLQAYDLFRQASDLQKAQQAYANTVAQLAFVHNLTSNIQHASKYFHQAKKMFDQYKLTKSKEYKQLLWTGALIIFRNDQFQKSFDYFRECLDIENTHGKQNILIDLENCITQFLDKPVRKLGLDTIRYSILDLLRKHFTSKDDLIKGIELKNATLNDDQ